MQLLLMVASSVPVVEHRMWNLLIFVVDAVNLYYKIKSNSNCLFLYYLNLLLVLRKLIVNVPLFPIGDSGIFFVHDRNDRNSFSLIVILKYKLK